MPALTESVILVGAAAERAAYIPAPRDRIGENDRFEIVERLGAGGMGHVFRAIDWHLDRTVAIKFILDNGGLPLDVLIRLLGREARATAKLSHENIVAIFDMDAYRGVPFLVMELLDGHSLEAMVKRAPLDALRATQIMTQVVRGLAHAHTHGIIHRDLKPSNVFVLRDGRAKILDFGISRIERPAVSASQGDSGPTLGGAGTPAFMAPEQWRGEAQDARTDIWSAGVVYYQMLTGRLPYTVPELLMKFSAPAGSRSLAPAARLLVPSVPEEADRIIATALNEDPAGRFQSAADLLEALHEVSRVLGGAEESRAVSHSAAQVERRPVTILSCYLKARRPLELDDIVEGDQRFYLACCDAVKRAEGCIGTPVGGKFYCCFGYPIARENDAQRAVRAALQIAQAMRERATPDERTLDFKIGIHTGVVGLPHLPGAAHGLPAMQGDVPGIADRLAEKAPADSVVVSRATLDLTGGTFLIEAQSKASRGGDGEQFRSPVYRVLGEIEPDSRFEHSNGAALTPLVGRQSELALLHQLWSDAKNENGRVVIVSGEPGVGKSRLVQTLKDRVKGEQNIRLWCQCWPQLRNSALHPIIEVTLRAMDIQREDAPEEKLTKLENHLAAWGFSLQRTAPLFGSLLSIPFESRYAPLTAPAEQQKVKTVEALVSMLRRMASSRPVLFIVEDMQWVDHSTMEYLNALMDAVAGARILVVLTSRPELQVPWSARRHLRSIALERLSPSSTAEMIEHALQERELPREIVERLVATADGIPLFVEELTRMVAESWQRSLAHEDAASGAEPRAMAEPAGRSQQILMTIPATLHELLLARLDRLRGAGKEVAQIGSILGREFHYELIRGVWPMDELSLQSGLEVLVEAGLLHLQGRPPAAKYVFKQALIQQAAYQSMIKGDRQRHHQRAAATLMEAFPETAEQNPELHAYHCWEAGNAREAVDFWEKAGQRAAQRSALVEAIDHYTKARDALKTLPEGPERDEKELGLLLALGSPLMSVHGYAAPEVEKTYARARDLARTARRQADIFPAMQGLWQFYYVRGMLPAARELGEELLEIAEGSGNSTFLLLAHRACAATVFIQGDLAGCKRHTEAGIAVYDMREHGSLALKTGHDPGVAHGVYLAWSLWMLGYPDQALSHVLASVELAKVLQHPLTIAYALCFAAVVRNHRGEHGEAAALADLALEITTDHKFALWTAWAKMQRGWAMAGQGELERGTEQMKQGLEEWMSTNARVGVTFFPVTLAELYLRAGQLSEATRLLDEATRVVGENDEHFCEAELWRLKGELALLGEGGAAEAEACYRRGLEIARAQNSGSWQLRLALSRGRLLASQGQVEEAIGQIRGALDQFTEGHETADVRQARARLDQYEGQREEAHSP